LALEKEKLKFFELLAEDKIMNIAETARELGVDRGTIYNWLELPESVEILKVESPALKAMKLKQLKTALHKASVSGNVPAIDLELKYEHGYNPTQKVEHSGSVELTGDAIRQAIEKAKS